MLPYPYQLFSVCFDVKFLMHQYPLSIKVFLTDSNYVNLKEIDSLLVKRNHKKDITQDVGTKWINKLFLSDYLENNNTNKHKPYFFMSIFVLFCQESMLLIYRMSKRPFNSECFERAS